MTWLYPSDFCEINEYYNKKLNKRKQKIEDGKFKGDPYSPVMYFICKPEASSQGRGIFICKKSLMKYVSKNSLHLYLVSYCKLYHSLIPTL